MRGGILVCACGLVLATAHLLTPAGGGHGTHEQLSIPPCSFLSRTGWPCPSCGLTTAVSAMAHGRLLLAWRAQPFGVALFALLVAAVAAGAAELITGRSVLRRLGVKAWWAWLLPAGMLAGWGAKALAGYLRGEYPLP